MNLPEVAEYPDTGTLLAKTVPGEGKTFAVGTEVPWVESVTRAMEAAADRERADDEPPSH